MQRVSGKIGPSDSRWLRRGKRFSVEPVLYGAWNNCMQIFSIFVLDAILLVHLVPAHTINIEEAVISGFLVVLDSHLEVN